METDATRRRARRRCPQAKEGGARANDGRRRYVSHPPHHTSDSVADAFRFCRLQASEVVSEEDSGAEEEEDSEEVHRAGVVVSSRGDEGDSEGGAVSRVDLVLVGREGQVDSEALPVVDSERLMEVEWVASRVDSMVRLVVVEGE